MAPKPKDEEVAVDGSVAEATGMMQETSISKPTCEELYGPYPSSIPIPFLSVRNEGREGDIPSKSVILDAKTMFDMPPDVRDVKSPDEWIPRDGRLVRLTGKHPFNVEPPLAVLEKHRFITPPCLHYVRNHGACPRLSWDDHRIAIGGEYGKATNLVPQPFTIGMDELASMPARELPVTLVCAGNRRKEQNMIRQTIGFNWGCAGVSTSVWKGVPLRDLLLRAGVSPDYQQHWDKHVEFIGVEDLPNKVGPGPFAHIEGEAWGKLVKYGTSVPLSRAMNPAYDILIAYEQNGEKLQPDHGYPVRLIIPGYIGGRMIKWLAAINVIPYETRNHYHYHDNRILPPHITAEESLTGQWWYKPEYIFNELNINSAIAKPDHNETLVISKNIDKHYELVGYAYNGGGRPISRVEISVDGGTHWELATVERKEKPTPHGMYWCWVWWSFRLPVSDLVGAKEIWCRAWDCSNNLQPNNPTWNLMGMGNNQTFKIKIHMDKNVKGESMFRFEHPTQPGQQKGGWMTRVGDKPSSAGFGRLLDEQGEAQDSSAAPTAKPSAGAGKLFAMAEIKKHNLEHDLWIVVNNKVYEVHDYLDLHPGGIDSITMNGGLDCTEDFAAIHSQKATKMLEKYCIGHVDLKTIEAAADEEEAVCEVTGRKIALNPKKKTPFRLQNKVVLSRDSFMLDFALPTPEHILGLPTGKHMFFSANIAGETVLRRYTPISSNHDIGCLKFVIKAYGPCERFPNGGKMSQYLDAMKIGEYLDFRGPVGEFEYYKNGHFSIDGEDHHVTKFNMIAGGTGITPVMQVGAEILRNTEDPTQLSLIFGCREENDLLMRSTLDEWAQQFPHKFKVHYILSDSWPDTWQYSTGFVDRALFKEHLFEAGKDVFNLMCGPPVMLERGCTPNLMSLGHEKKRIFAF